MKKDQNGWQSTEAGQRMMATLTEESTLSAITRLLQKMDAIEDSLENLNKAIKQTPQMVSMAADIVDETYANAKLKGVDLDSRVKNLMMLAKKISDPVIANRLEATLATFNQVPGLTAMLVDSLDDEVTHLKQQGIHLEDRVSGLFKLVEMLSQPRLVTQLESILKVVATMPETVSMLADMADEQMSELVGSGVDPQNLGKITTKAIKALSKTGDTEIESAGGIFKMLRKFADPDRQKALGFLLAFLKNLGKEL